MESKMQEQYDASEAHADAIFEAMSRFEEWYLTMPDVDETLIKEKVEYFNYKNSSLNEMWIIFRAGAGV